ncbi:hypothetical protein PV396_13665 [Streptomyces sp. ME02-8801-2C]|uniref:hypothetical protein n=1 Tax=Streptomyces sp. ME02-8801-2C TaxID=3028680 RepID=UPI0029B0A3A5|nr:hypothetical protein [Streptomyces sp. ME02-8801-2C]MDX3452986.1 hypothetical protein [Streptomyces sp. ME02-8801-2C]
MTVGGWCRALRAGVFAAVCVLLAALGHVIMSGAPVPWWTMAVGAMAMGAVGWFLAGRERGLALIVTVVVAAQTVLHETFSLGRTVMPGTTADSAATAAAMGGMGMGSSGAMSMEVMDMSGMTHMSHGSGGMEHTHGMAGMGGSASFGMLAAHLLAAVLCGLWLAYGERAVFRVLRAAAARLVAPLRMLLALPVAAGGPSVRRRRGDAHRSSLARFLLCYSVTSRGPPRDAAVV